MSVCRQYLLVTSPQMLKRWLTLCVYGINLVLLEIPTPDNPLKFIHWILIYPVDNAIHHLNNRGQREIDKVVQSVLKATTKATISLA